jgi:hypothetical protein
LGFFLPRLAWTMILLFMLPDVTEMTGMNHCTHCSYWSRWGLVNMICAG